MQDSYENDGIKTDERKKRGCTSGTRYILNNLDMKIPFDISSFLAVGENKKDLFQLIQKGIGEQKLDDTVILFSGKGTMTEICESSTIVRNDIACQHSEADYMFALYAREEENVLIRSRSGDTDIIVSLIGHQDLPESLFVDNGTGSGRKLLQPSLCELSSEQRSAIIGFWSFIGNDYLGSFFRKGKKTGWKVAKKNKKFLDFFTKLGTSDNSSDLMTTAETFVCALYGKPKLMCVNAARTEIFWDRYKKNKKVAELSLLPPCRENLRFHLQRANFVAKLLRSTSLIPGCDDYTQHGWSSSGEPIWTTEVVPENIIDILRESTPDEEEPPNDDDQVNDADNDDDEDVEIVDYS